MELAPGAYQQDLPYDVPIHCLIKLSSANPSVFRTQLADLRIKSYFCKPLHEQGEGNRLAWEGGMVIEGSPRNEKT